MVPCEQNTGAVIGQREWHDGFTFERLAALVDEDVREVALQSQTAEHQRRAQCRDHHLVSATQIKKGYSYKNTKSF